MKVSVVTVTWNSATTLRDTLESVLAQTYCDIEHIIVDGGSMDGTMRLVQEYEPRYNGRLRYISEPDRGIYDAMNKGIGMASGEVVGILNSDDFYTSPDAVEKLVGELVGCHVDAVFGDIHYVDDKDLDKCVRYYSSASFKRWKMLLGFMPAHPSFYCRKQVYERYGMFSTSYKVAADFENLLRLIYVGKISIKYVPMDCVTMRTGGASTSGLASHRQILADHVRAYRENHVRSNALLDSLRYVYKVVEIAKYKLIQNRTMKKFLVVLLLLLVTVSLQLSAQTRSGTVDIFMGADFNYRDIYFNNRVYDVLLNLTPGIKWNMGHRWEVAAQVFVPVVNQYGDRYKKVRLNMAVLSKQLVVGQHWKMKLSGGLFGSERYGLDLRNMFVFNPWLAMTAQVGLTGYCSMATGWEASTMKRLTAQVGPEFYLHRWNTQISIRGGRYVYGDYGMIGEGFRHFKHVSIGVYVSYSNKGKEDAGFKVIMMLPPYKRAVRKINIRPASNFRLTYSVEGNGYANCTYFTDPEQNEREGWFDRDLLPWGTDTMTPDFTFKRRKEEKKNEE